MTVIKIENVMNNLNNAFSEFKIMKSFLLLE